jgi:hypothetical protein
MFVNVELSSRKKVLMRSKANFFYKIGLISSVYFLLHYIILPIARFLVEGASFGNMINWLFLIVPLTAYILVICYASFFRWFYFKFPINRTYVFGLFLPILLADIIFIVFQMKYCIHINRIWNSFFPMWRYLLTVRLFMFFDISKAILQYKE